MENLFKNQHMTGKQRVKFAVLIITIIGMLCMFAYQVMLEVNKNVSDGRYNKQTELRRHFVPFP